MSTLTQRILLIDDHALLREGLKQMLEQQEGLRVVGQAEDGAQADLILAREEVEVVVLDLQLATTQGLDWARSRQGRSGGPRIVVLSSLGDARTVQEALQAGVSGYVVKTNPLEELVRAIRLAAEGHLYLCPVVMTAFLRGGGAGSVASAEPSLNEKDREIVRLVALGMRNKEVAEQMGLSQKTVETYRIRLMHRLGCESTADLVRWAVRAKLVTP